MTYQIKKGEGALISPPVITMRNIQKLSVLLMALVLCVCSLVTVPAFAASNNTGYGTAVFGNSQDIQSNKNESGNSDGNYHSDKYGDIPTASEVLGIEGKDPVTTGDVDNWVDRKGGELIAIVTKGVRIVAVIGFFVSLLLVIVGAVGNRRTMVGGIIGLIISCLCFTAATMGPQIIVAVQSWLIS